MGIHLGTFFGIHYQRRPMHELNGQPHLDKVAPILGTLTLKDYSIRPQKQQKRKKEKGKNLEVESQLFA